MTELCGLGDVVLPLKPCWIWRCIDLPGGHQAEINCKYLTRERQKDHFNRCFHEIVEHLPPSSRPDPTVMFPEGPLTEVDSIPEEDQMWFALTMTILSLKMYGCLVGSCIKYENARDGGVYTEAAGLLMQEWLDDHGFDLKRGGYFQFHLYAPAFPIGDTGRSYRLPEPVTARARVFPDLEERPPLMDRYLNLWKMELARSMHQSICTGFTSFMVPLDYENRNIERIQEIKKTFSQKCLAGGVAVAVAAGTLFANWISAKYIYMW